MNYQEIHDRLIELARSERTVVEFNKETNKWQIDNYREEHHIIPDCFYINNRSKGKRPGWLEGNPDAPENLVLLTGREHFIIHQLLVKLYPKHSGLIFAAHRMIFGNKYQRRSKNKLHGWLRRRHAENLSIANTGKLRPECSNKGERNGMWGKHHSKETINKIIQTQKYRPNKKSKSIICVELSELLRTRRKRSFFPITRKELLTIQRHISRTNRS